DDRTIDDLHDLNLFREGRKLVRRIALPAAAAEHTEAETTATAGGTSATAATAFGTTASTRPAASGIRERLTHFLGGHPFAVAALGHHLLALAYGLARVAVEGHGRDDVAAFFHHRFDGKGRELRIRDFGRRRP